MNSLQVLPTDRVKMDSCCVKLILAAEIECGEFTSVVKRLFGERLALRAGGLWVDALEEDSSFRSHSFAK